MKTPTISQNYTIDDSITTSSHPNVCCKLLTVATVISASLSGAFASANEYGTLVQQNPFIARQYHDSLNSQLRELPVESPETTCPNPQLAARRLEILTQNHKCPETPSGIFNQFRDQILAKIAKLRDALCSITPNSNRDICLDR